MSSEAAAREVCAVETILHPRDMKRRNRRWYDLQKEYNLAEFEVRLIVGTGLRFQIWSKDGVRSRDHEEIMVQWEDVDGRVQGVGGVGAQGGWEAGQGVYRW